VRFANDMHYIFLALTNPEESREDEFNAWYNLHHAQEVLRYGRGFLKARRYRREPLAEGRDCFPWRYLALYEMVSDDLRAYHQAPWTQSNPPLTPFRGLLKDDHAAWVYRSCVPPHTARDSAQDPSSPAAQASALVFELARVDPGGEHAFNDWQDRTQVPRVRAQSTAAIVVRRYILAEHQRPSQPDLYWKYLTTYELAEDERDQLPSLLDAVAPAGVRENSDRRLWSERRVCAWTAISGCYRTETPD
jgi:hypothetical protein